MSSSTSSDQSLLLLLMSMSGKAPPLPMRMVKNADTSALIIPTASTAVILHDGYSPNPPCQDITTYRYS
jgi:hypothetical protein